MVILQGQQPEVASRALLDQFADIGTSTIGNVLDDLGLDGIILNVKPIASGMKFVGTALTVKEVSGVRGTYRPEEFGLGAVVDAVRPGDVVVIDNGGQQISTWGGVASVSAQMNGAAGLVVDGGVRDADEIVEIGFPVFSRHVVPLSGKTRIKVIEVNTVVKIDGIMVSPGDILVGDMTGIVRVPLARADEIAAAARRLEQQDRQAVLEVRSGLSFTQALKKFSRL